MDKRIYINNIYIGMCILVDSDVRFETAKEIIINILEDSLKDEHLKDIPSDKKELLLELRNEISKKSALFTNEEKTIIVNNLLKETYCMIQANNIAWDNSLTYKERERGHYKYILKDILLKVLISFLGGIKNLKKEYSQFKVDLKNYSINLSIISELADDSAEGIKEAIEERKKDAIKLIEKYSMFNISEYDLRSIVEADILQFKNKCKENNRKESKINLNIAV